MNHLFNLLTNYQVISLLEMTCTYYILWTENFWCGFDCFHYTFYCTIKFCSIISIFLQSYHINLITLLIATHCMYTSIVFGNSNVGEMKNSCHGFLSFYWNSCWVNYHQYILIIFLHHQAICNSGHLWLRPFISTRSAFKSGFSIVSHKL